MRKILIEIPIMKFLKNSSAKLKFKAEHFLGHGLSDRESQLRVT